MAHRRPPALTQAYRSQARAATALTCQCTHQIREQENWGGELVWLVAHRGFEPLVSALRGRCPRPLDECAVSMQKIAFSASARQRLAGLIRLRLGAGGDAKRPVGRGHALRPRCDRRRRGRRGALLVAHEQGVFPHVEEGSAHGDPCQQARRARRLSADGDCPWRRPLPGACATSAAARAIAIGTSVATISACSTAAARAAFSSSLSRGIASACWNVA